MIISKMTISIMHITHENGAQHYSRKKFSRVSKVKSTILNVILRNVVMLSAIILIVATPS
jgi:hypothetical protein